MTDVNIEAPAGVEVPEVEVVEIDRVELDLELQAGLTSTQLSLESLAGMRVACQEARVWEDPNVTDDEGNPFQSEGHWLAHRVSKFPLVEKAMAPEFALALLEAGVSVRATEEALNGQIKKSAISEINVARKGRKTSKDKAAEGEASTEGGAPASDKDVKGKGSTPQQEAKKAASQVVKALAHFADLIADATAEDITRVRAAWAEHSATIDAMEATNPEGAQPEVEGDVESPEVPEVAEVPEVEAPAPAPRGRSRKAVA
jgi:hypothetical protein